MRRKCDPETDEQRSDRLKRLSQDRRARVSAEDEALDAAVRLSIKHLGP